MIRISCFPEQRLKVATCSWAQASPPFETIAAMRRPLGPAKAIAFCAVPYLCWTLFWSFSVPLDTPPLERPIRRKALQTQPRGTNAELSNTEAVQNRADTSKLLTVTPTRAPTDQPTLSMPSCENREANVKAAFEGSVPVLEKRVSKLQKKKVTALESGDYDAAKKIDTLTTAQIPGTIKARKGSTAHSNGHKKWKQSPPGMALQAVVTVLNRVRADWFLASGTLLGFVRDCEVGLSSSHSHPLVFILLVSSGSTQKTNRRHRLW